MTESFPITSPDLLIFDVDGTLHDTFAWWTPVIRRGLALYTEQTGIATYCPDDAHAESVVGMKDAGVWDPFLHEGEKHRWADVRSVVVPLEVEVLQSGADYLFPGIRPLLAHLRSIGVGTAIASNCRSMYFGAVKAGQGLEAATDWQFCLDSEGVENKADMLRRALEVSGASRPVMVGDREPDHEAALEVGMPFIWRANDRCTIDDADASWTGDPNEFLSLLGLPRISS